MHILYDGYVFSAQPAGGINRYFSSIIQRLPSDWEPIIWYSSVPGSFRPEHRRLKERSFRGAWIQSPGLRRILCRTYFKTLNYAGGFDVLHPTYHFGLANETMTRNGVPVVFTVYDLILEIYQREMDPSGSNIAAKKRAIESATAILCISQSTKHDLQEFYHIPDERIVVTYLGSDLSQAISFGPEPIPATPYVLFMGNRAIYKNFVRTLLAYERAVDAWPELTFCVVGAPFSPAELELLRALRIEKKVQNIGFVPDAHLAKLYRCSEALLYPSLYEGFGIPPLEAMACGTLVITSSRASLPEVVGDAAIVIDPENVDEIAEAMLSLRSQGNRRTEFIEKGLTRAKLFSWDKTAEETTSVYRSFSRQPHSVSSSTTPVSCPH